MIIFRHKYRNYSPHIKFSTWYIGALGLNLPAMTIKSKL